VRNIPTHTNNFNPLYIFYTTKGDIVLVCDGSILLVRHQNLLPGEFEIKLRKTSRRIQQEHVEHTFWVSDKGLEPNFHDLALSMDENKILNLKDITSLKLLQDILLLISI
jgi:hypothetical protein